MNDYYNAGLQYPYQQPAVIRQPVLKDTIGAKHKSTQKSRCVSVDVYNKRMVIINDKATNIECGCENHVNLDPIPGTVTHNKIADYTSTVEDIAKGYIEIKNVEQVIYCNNISFNILIRFVSVTGEEREDRLNVNDIDNNAILDKFLKHNGLIYEKRYLKYLSWYIRERMQTAQTHTVYQGFYFKDKLLCHSDQETIFRFASDNEEIAKVICSGTTDENADIVYKLIVFSLCCVAACSSLLNNNDKVYPTIVCVNSDIDVMQQNIMELFCCSKEQIINVSDIISGKAPVVIDKAAILQLNGETSYKTEKYLRLLGCNEVCSSKPGSKLLLLSSDQMFDKISCENYLFIPYKPIGTKKDLNIGYWFAKKLLTVKGFMYDFFERYCENFNAYNKDGYVNSSKQHLFAAMISAMHITLELLGSDREHVSTLCHEMIEQLYDYSDIQGSMIVSQLIEFVSADRDIAVIRKNACTCVPKEAMILCDDSYMYLNRITLKHIADKIGTTPLGIINQLKNSGLLDGGSKDSYTKNIALGGKTSTHLYALRQQDFFSIGNVMLEPDDFSESKPLMMLPLGSNNNTDIYFALDKLNGEENGHCSIMGSSGFGKSYLQAMLAKQAVLNGYEVVFITKDDSRNNYIEAADIGCEVYISDEMEYPKIDWNQVCQPGKISVFTVECADNYLLEQVLNDYYNHKRLQKKPINCFLMIDECQDFNLEQDSVLVSKLMKKSRKLGTMVVLSSQFLSSKNATNVSAVLSLCTTAFEFRAVSASRSAERLKLTADDNHYHEYKRLLNELDVGYCLAKGKLATNRCKISYPVVIRVPYSK